MLESESKLQNTFSPSQLQPNFSSQNSQQTTGNINHQINGPSLHQNNTTMSSSSGITNLPPGLPSGQSSISTAQTSSVMSNGRLPLKQPPPGFGHQSMMSQDSHSFGMVGQQDSGGLGDNNFQTAINQHQFRGQQNEFIGGTGFSAPSTRSGLRNISGGGANSGATYHPHSNNHLQSMQQQQMNHTNHQQVSDLHAHNRLTSTSSTAGSVGSVDHLQHQLRQLALEKQNMQQSKDWQEGLRALLPNVNVSFGALPNNSSGFVGNNNLNSNPSAHGHSHMDLEGRFNNSQHQLGPTLTPSNSSTNNHLLNDHSPHNLLNSLHQQQTGQNQSSLNQQHQHQNHLNHLSHHPQHQHMSLQQHHERSQMQQHRQHAGKPIT